MKFEKQAYILRNVIHTIELKEFKKNFFIAGGACTAVFNRRRMNDVDIFFRNEEDYNKVKEFITDNDNYELKFNTDNARSYDHIDSKGKITKVQLIKAKFSGTPKEVISNFDFTICMCAFVPDTEEFVMDETFLLHLAEKTLCFNPDSEYPLSSLYRMHKFRDRDFKISALELLKISLCINNLKLDTYRDVRKQLEGVDVYLLKDMTDYLVEHSSESFDFKKFMTYAEKYLSDFYGED